jgi:enoyl-[acyl-carrier-protein] reductase (NADH)
LREGVQALGAELAVTYLNDKAKNISSRSRTSSEAPIFMPLDVRTTGQMEAVFERIAKTLGRARFSSFTRSPFHPRTRCKGGWSMFRARAS